MHYKTSHYRTTYLGRSKGLCSQGRLHRIPRKKNKTDQRPKNDPEWLAAQFAIVGLALAKLQLGWVEDCSVKIQHPARYAYFIGSGFVSSLSLKGQILPTRNKTDKINMRVMTSQCETSGKNYICQHFSFHAKKKTLDRERPFSLALRVVLVSLFSYLPCLAPSVTRVVICDSRAFCSTDYEKREAARSLRGHFL